MATFVDSSIFPPCGNNPCVLLSSVKSHICNSKGSRRKRETKQEEQGFETSHSDKYDKVDLMMNPEKAEQYQNLVERTKQDIRWKQSLSLTVKRFNYLVLLQEYL